jgi:two-component sensor histidine kinase/PAS domain-containing protein
VDKPPALYYLYKLDADRDFRIAFILNEGSFHRAVLKGRAELLALVEKGFASVDKGVYTAIDRSWLGAPIASRIDLRLLALVLAALTILLVVFGTSAWILRRRVNVATSALREKIGLLEASEAKNRAFISALPDLFFVIDREGRYLDFSASDPSKLALPPSAFLGKRFVELGFPAAAIEAFMANLERTLRTGEISVFDYSLPVGMETLSFEGRIVALSPDRALLVSRDITDVHRQEERLRRSLAEKEILLKEIHHRVKNNMQVISSLIALQAESFRDEGDRLLLAEAQQRIRAMARLHELLYDSPDLESIGAIEYLESLSGELAMGYGSRPVRISGPAALRLTIDQAVPFGLIANELASNALKYAYPRGEGGEIDIHLSREEGRISLVVEDHGRGLEPGLDPLEAKSMGFLLVRSLAAQLGGRLDFGGPPGVRVRLVFDAD